MIRYALPIDYDDILNIKQTLSLDSKRIYDTQYKLEIEQRGFLLPSEYTHDDFHKDLRKVFLVVEIDGIVIGFLRVDETQEFQHTSPLQWIHSEYKETYFSNPHAVIGGMGILPEYMHHGYGIELLRETLKEVNKRRIPELFSIVTSGPVCNQLSLVFHERNGFIKVAKTEKGNMFGLHDYQSMLFVKEIV